MKNSKLLEDANRGDFLVYLQSITFYSGANSIELIPVGSVLEIKSIYRKKDGLCTIKVNGVHVFESPEVILIDNFKTFTYKEFIILDKTNKPTIYTLYDI